ncbi:MAG: hypothetical protein QOF21_2447 [Actinomycetota bacterium]|jgi:hypothetical protein
MRALDTDRRPPDGLWSAALTRRLRERSDPPCAGCEDPARELLLLWRRGKGLRRRRVFR